MIGDGVGFQFAVLLERVYCTDLGKHVEAGTILMPMAIVDTSHSFIIMNEKAWAGHKNLDILRFPFHVMMSSQKPLVAHLGPNFKPTNPLTEEEIKMFRMLYES